MRKALLLVACVCVLVGGCCPMRCCCPMAKKPSERYMGTLRHVVLFKFKDGATKEQIKAVEDAFRALPAKIPEILDFEWGTDVSVENLAAGYTHCFFVTFADARAREVYLPHPDHKAFGKLLGPILDKVLVIDYYAAR
jgi:hypothetical protein